MNNLSKYFFKRTILTALFVLSIAPKTVPVYSQNAFHVHLDYSYLLGLYEKSDLWTIKSDLRGFDISVAGMYDFNKQISAGIGVGIEKLHEPNYTIIPVFAKVTYSPFQSNDKPYIFTKLGYSIGTEYSNAGLLFNPGLGYKLKFRKHFGLNFKVGYHLQTIRYDKVSYSEAGAVVSKTKDNNYRQSLQLGMGFIF